MKGFSYKAEFKAEAVKQVKERFLVPLKYETTHFKNLEMINEHFNT